ncbi:MAG: hypothetical protein HY000_17450 [Planctomycetes bacterium]|nr:hypothetical protein [Planctomycetota bacterium]
MAQSAAVVATAPFDFAAVLDRWMAAWNVPPIRWLRDTCRRLADRVGAKFSYHDSRRYRELIRRAAAHIGPGVEIDSLVRDIRKLDPSGLGVWYLARSPRGSDLVELCRRTLLTPHAGPPRPVTRWLEQGLAGMHLWWSRDPCWCDALSSQTLIAAAVSALLAARELTGNPSKSHWSAAQSSLLAAAKAVQTVDRVYPKAFDRRIPAASEAAGLTYQALNLLRRIVNQTALAAVDEQLGSEAARLAIRAAHTACYTASELATLRPQPLPAHSVPNRLAALARSVDALAFRAAASLHAESSLVEGEDTWVSQTVRVLASTCSALGDRGSGPDASQALCQSEDGNEICRWSNALAETSAETLDAWGWIYEWTGAAALEPDSQPPWVTTLVDALTGNLASRDVIEAVRALACADERALPAAVCMAALCGGLRRLRRELWGLIQATDSSRKERSLAFQLFWKQFGHNRPLTPSVKTPCRQTGLGS